MSPGGEALPAEGGEQILMELEPDRVVRLHVVGEVSMLARIDPRKRPTESVPIGRETRKRTGQNSENRLHGVVDPRQPIDEADVVRMIAVIVRNERASDPADLPVTTDALESGIGDQAIDELTTPSDERPGETDLRRHEHDRSCGHHSPAATLSQSKIPGSSTSPTAPRHNRCMRCSALTRIDDARSTMRSPHPSHTATNTSPGVEVASCSTEVNVSAVTKSSSSTETLEPSGVWSNLAVPDGARRSRTSLHRVVPAGPCQGAGDLSPNKSGCVTE